jgi:hypothetical protein
VLCDGSTFGGLYGDAPSGKRGCGPAWPSTAKEGGVGLPPFLRAGPCGRLLLCCCFLVAASVGVRMQRRRREERLPPRRRWSAGCLRLQDLKRKHVDVHRQFGHQSLERSRLWASVVPRETLGGGCPCPKDPPPCTRAGPNGSLFPLHACRSPRDKLEERQRTRRRSSPSRPSVEPGSAAPSRSNDGGEPRSVRQCLLRAAAVAPEEVGRRRTVQVTRTASA